MGRALFGFVILLVGCHSGASPMTKADLEAERGRVAATLDALHEAASKAEEERYFALFAEDGVFLGTDATERWDKAAFQAYAHPHFAKGKGWTYTSRERHIELAADGSYAWFDELLDNAKLGVCRGSGVLRREGKAWKIVQYNLTIPVPNAIAYEVAEQIRVLGKSGD